MSRANPVLTIGTFPARFIRQVIGELKEVSWPSRRQTIQSTLVVIVVSVAVGAYIAGLDLLFTKGFEVLLRTK